MFILWDVKLSVLTFKVILLVRVFDAFVASERILGIVNEYGAQGCFGVALCV